MATESLDSPSTLYLQRSVINNPREIPNMDPKFLRKVRKTCRSVKGDPTLLDNAEFKSTVQDMFKRLTPEVKAKYGPRYGIKL